MGKRSLLFFIILSTVFLLGTAWASDFDINQAPNNSEIEVPEMQSAIESPEDTYGQSDEPIYIYGGESGIEGSDSVNSGLIEMISDMPSETEIRDGAWDYEQYDQYNQYDQWDAFEYHNIYCIATVNNSNPDERLHLREGPSRDTESLGLYYNGVEVNCLNNPYENTWVSVTIGNLHGYMLSDYLLPEPKPEDIIISTPIMLVNNASPASWLNLRESPSLQANVLGKYYNGKEVTVLGGKDSWYHVKVDDVIGFMVKDYLKEQNGAPSPTPTQRQNELKYYGAYQLFDRGYTVSASLYETSTYEFNLDIYINFSENFATEDPIESYNLYINNQFITSALPSEPNAPAYGQSFYYDGDIQSLRIVPVMAMAGEKMLEEIVLQ